MPLTAEQILQDSEFYNLPEPERIKVLSTVDPEFTQLPESEQLKVVQKAPNINPPTDLKWEQDYPTKRKISKVARIGLQTGGLVVGSVIGSGAGPIGAVGGAGLLYGAGSNVADRLDEFLGLANKMKLEESLKKAATDITEGAMYEMGGQVAGKAISLVGTGIWKLAETMGLGRLFKRIKGFFPDLSDAGILKKAREELENLRKLTPESEKTFKETKSLLERRKITTEPTYAQKTGSIKAGAFEQSAAAKNREINEILKGKDAKINQEALDSIQKEFAKPGTVQDVILGVEGKQTLLKSEADKTLAAVSEKVAPLQLVKTPQGAGIDIKTTLEIAKKSEKKAIKAIYDQIPENIQLDASRLKTGLRDLKTDFNKIGGGSGTYPSDINRQIFKELKKTKGETITFDKLRDWKSQIGEEKRAAILGINPNLKLYRRLKLLEDTIDDTMDQMLEMAPEVSQLYKTASDRFKQFAITFKRGTVGEVLQAGNLPEGGKIAFSDIPSRFFKTGKMDSADDLVRALGKEKAAKLIDDYASSDFVSRVMDAGKLNPKVASKWLLSNWTVLEKYGLTKKFTDIVKTGEVSVKALENLNAYNKTIASKIIGIDVEDVVRSLFSGAGKLKSATTANQLLKLPGIKENPAAINGIKNSFKDFLLQQMEVSAVDVAGNPVRSIAKAKSVLNEYLPALRVLYKDSPEKIKALVDYHEILQMLARNKFVTFAGGSTTAEKFTGTDAMRTIGKNVAQYMAVSAGAGWKFSVFRNLWSATLGAPRRFSESQVAALLTESIHNPEVAKTIMDATKAGFKQSTELWRRLRNHLITLGLYGGFSKENKE